MIVVHGETLWSPAPQPMDDDDDDDDDPVILIMFILEKQTRQRTLFSMFGRETAKDSKLLGKLCIKM